MRCFETEAFSGPVVQSLHGKGDVVAGAVITLLSICGLTHRQSYLDIFVVAVAAPIVALVAVVLLGSAYGSF